MPEKEPADFQTRLLARVVDGLILGVPSFIIISGEYYNHFQYFPNAICLALGIIYSVGFLSSAWQATPGMRLLKIFVVRAGDSRRLSRARALARYFIYNAAFLFFLAIPSLNPKLPANYVGDEAKRYEVLYAKDQNHLPMAPEDRKFLDKAYAEVGAARKSTPRDFLFACAYRLIIVLTVVFTKQKTGLHDMVCETRVLCGAPPSPSPVADAALPGMR
ncbi:MAG: RDD family protein [Terracidiphilus sp.]